jgi:hypothetical protein
MEEFFCSVQADPNYFAITRQCPAERNLLVAVLERAIKDAARMFDIRTSNPKASTNNARAWIESDEEEEFTYLWICSELGLDAESLRDGIAMLIVSFKQSGDKHLFSHRKRHGDK